MKREQALGKVGYRKRDIEGVLIALNSTGASFFKYPLGNKGLCEKVTALEEGKKIIFNRLLSRWETYTKKKESYY